MTQHPDPWPGEAVDAPPPAGHPSPWSSASPWTQPPAQPPVEPLSPVPPPDPVPPADPPSPHGPLPDPPWHAAPAWNAAPPYPAPPYPAPPYPAPSYPAPSYPAPSYPAPSWNAPPPPHPAVPWNVAGPAQFAGPPADARWRPTRIDPVPGTPFGLIQLEVAPITSGFAIGSTVAAIASVLVSLLVLCFGLTGRSAGWGGWVAGAFTVLGVLAGAGAIVLGLLGSRQISRSALPGRVQFRGRGQAITGIAIGCVGVVISLAALGLAVLLQLR